MPSAVAEAPASTPTESELTEQANDTALGSEIVDMTPEPPEPPSLANPAPETAEAPEAAEAESPEAPADPFDAEFLKRAEFYGFDAETAKSYGTPDALERTFAAMDRQAAQWARSNGQPEPTPEQQSAAAHAAPQAPQTQQQQLTAALEKFKLELDPDAWDEKSLKAFQGFNDYVHQSLTDIQSKNEQYIRALAEKTYDLQAQLQQYTGQQQAEEDSRFEREFDTSFANMGDEFKDVFGKVPTRTLAENSPLRAARIAVWDEMNALSLADAKLNRPKSTTGDLVQRAVRSLYPDKLKSIARKEVLQQVEAQRGTHIERPTGQRPRPKTGLEAAYAFARNHPILKNAGEDSGGY